MLYQVHLWRKYRWHDNKIKKSKMKKLGTTEVKGSNADQKCLGSKSRRPEKE